MQDIHWSAGHFGYFPAYAIGSLIAAQLFSTIRKKVPHILSNFKLGNFSELTQWLKKNIYSKASSTNQQNLLEQATGEVLNPNYFLKHIKQRYLDNKQSN